MSLDSDSIAAGDLRWHVSEVHLTGRRATSRPDDSLRDPNHGRAGQAVALPPLWRRILTGQSFAWRVRSLRRGLARRTLRWLQLHPEIRHAALSGSTLRLLAGAVRERRRRATTGRRFHLPRVHLVNAVAVIPASSRIGSAVDLDDGSGPTLNISVSADGEMVEVTGPGGRRVSVLVPVDLRLWNPSTFQQRPSERSIALTEVFDETSSQRARIARAQRSWSVRLDADADRPPAELARMITDLAVSGVALVGRPNDAVVDLIGAEVVDRIGLSADRSFGDERERELYSVQLRRAALARHSPRGWWQSVVPLVGGEVVALPSVSVLLPSNRPEDVIGAARLVASQVDVRTQLVVGLHGAHMPATLDEDLAAVYPGDLVVRRCPDEWTLGHVMNDITQAATGDLVSKWDDDDWYEPQHLADLAWALEFSGASLVGKAAEFVYLEALDLTVRRFATGSERRSTTIAGGTLMMTRDELVEVGWADVPRQVDRRLIDDLQLRSRSVYRTHGLGYILRRRSSHMAGHTWLAGDDYFLRQASDQRPGVDLEFAGFGASA